VTSRVIVALAAAASACLVLGSWLLDGDSTGSGLLALASLALGTALAAAAVAGAWRPPASTQAEPAQADASKPDTRQSITPRGPDPSRDRRSPQATR
jgi:hypothetical protein